MLTTAIPEARARRYEEIHAKRLCHQCQVRPPCAEYALMFCGQCVVQAVVSDFVNCGGAKQHYGKVERAVAVSWARSATDPLSRCGICGLLCLTLRTLGMRQRWMPMRCWWRLTPDHISGDSTDHSVSNIRFLCDLCNRIRGRGRPDGYVGSQAARRWGDSWRDATRLNERLLRTLPVA